MTHRATRSRWERQPEARGLARSLASLYPLLCAVLLAPSTLYATDLAVPEQVISGYEEGVRFHVPRGVALDPAREELIVANTGDHRIEIYSLRGRSLARFVHNVRLADGTEMPGLPRAVAVLPTGRIAVTDNLSSTVDILDRRGRIVAQLSLPSSAKGSPLALAVTPDGGLLVGGPSGDDRIHRFDAAFHLVASWGVRGGEPGQLSAISGIAVLPDGRVAVTCADSKVAVQVFSQDGTYAFGFGKHDIGHGNFSLPSGIAATSDGRIWVSDEVRQIVQVFDASGTFLGMFGGFGAAAGDLNYPSALASDGGRRLAVAEREFGRVQILNTNGGGEGTAKNVP